jgi:hypothetical protein
MREEEAHLAAQSVAHAALLEYNFLFSLEYLVLRP